MRKLAFVVAAACLFALAPIAERFGPVASSVVLVWSSVLAAVIASGSVQSVTVTAGAAGAFGGGMLGTVSPAAAGAVLMVAAFAERTTRIRQRNARAVHLLVALVTGALAGSLSQAFSTSSMSVAAVALVVAAVLASLPLLVEADDAVAHALDEASRAVTGPASATLADAAELRRRANELDLPMERTEATRLRGTWQALLRLSEARVRLERSGPSFALRVGTVPAAPAVAERVDDGPKVTPATNPSEPSTDAGSRTDAEAASKRSTISAGASGDVVRAMVDERIAEHVGALARAYAAVGAVRAAAVSLDDSAQRAVESMGESLDEVSRAMVEVRDVRAPGAKAG